MIASAARNLARSTRRRLHTSKTVGALSAAVDAKPSEAADVASAASQAVILFGREARQSALSATKAVIEPLSSVSAETKPIVSFYKRELPKHLVAFSSPEGMKLFQEAMSLGGLGAPYFMLMEQFTTQSEPAYCGLATLSMVLNSLKVDPGRVWKGSWRWFTDENLLCQKGTCNSCLLVGREMGQKGITLTEFVQLAKCNGGNVVDLRACDATLEGFRRNIITTTKIDNLRLVTAFNRSSLGQTGQGHFSPIAGYHPEKDLVLVLDVARFKYPPFWVSVESLWEAMQSTDAESGESRGYCMVSNQPICPGVRMDLLKKSSEPLMAKRRNLS